MGRGLCGIVFASLAACSSGQAIEERPCPSYGPENHVMPISSETLRAISPYTDDLGLRVLVDAYPGCPLFVTVDSADHPYVRMQKEVARGIRSEDDLLRSLARDPYLGDD